MLGIGALFLLFVLLYSQRVASQSCETLGELLQPILLRRRSLGSSRNLSPWGRNIA